MLFWHAQKHFVARKSEWLLAGMMFSIGMMLLQPSELFHSSSIFIALENIATEDTWGWFCIVFSSIRLVALIVNGAWVPSSYHLRAFTAFVACLFWFQLTLGLIVVERPSILLAIVPWLFIADLLNCHRAASDVQKDRLLTAIGV